MRARARSRPLGGCPVRGHDSRDHGGDLSRPVPDRLCRYAGQHGRHIAGRLTSEAFRPASLSVIAEIVPAEKRRAAYALNRVAVNLGWAIGPAVGGLLADRWFPAIFVVDGCTSLLAALLQRYGSTVLWSGAFALGITAALLLSLPAKLAQVATRLANGAANAGS